MLAGVRKVWVGSYPEVVMDRPNGVKLSPSGVEPTRWPLDRKVFSVRFRALAARPRVSNGQKVLD